MAGVGFELKKLFRSKRGYLDTVRGYLVTAAVTEGPMVLNIVLLFSVRLLLRLYGAGYNVQELYLITTTYVMIFSLLLSNVFLMLVSRFISDSIYQDRKEQILPSFFSLLFYLLVLGGLVSGIYLMLLDLAFTYKVLLFLQFELMLVMWVQMSYLSAVKKYSKVLIGFLVSSFAAIGLSLVLMVLGVEILTAAYLGSAAGFFLMVVLYMQEMVSFFPGGPMRLGTLLPYVGQYRSLMLTGFLSALGLFGHNFVYWCSDYHTRVIPRMVYCMKYDVAAFFASLTIVPYLVIFVVALEVNFYKAYRSYFDTILYGGTLEEIRLEKRNLSLTLFRELAHVFELQFFVELLCVTFLGNFLQMIGFDREMLIIFRYLCIGYCFYVLVKSLVILLLYFDDRAGALTLSALFAASSILLSALTLFFGVETYGLGFLGAGILTSVTGLVKLYRYVNRLEYQVFCSQPLVYEEPSGLFRRMADYLETHQEGPGDFRAHYKPTRRQQRRIKRRERAAARRGRHGARPAQEEPQHETQ